MVFVLKFGFETIYTQRRTDNRNKSLAIGACLLICILAIKCHETSFLLSILFKMTYTFQQSLQDNVHKML